MANKKISKCYGFLLIIIILICVLFSSCTTDGNTTQDETQPTETGEQNRTTQQKDTIHKVGDTITLGNNKLTVSEVTKSQGSEFDKPKSGNEYVIVNVTIENAGNTQISYNPFDFKVQNSQGQITDIAFTTINQDTALQSGELASGGKVSGTIAFEEPKDDAGLQLQYSPGFFSGDVVKVNLQ